jgi:hypothetical protein
VLFLESLGMRPLPLPGFQRVPGVPKFLEVSA